jgi:ubiquinone/menaquinone biosynthesis C-methylase UbiE
VKGREWYQADTVADAYEDKRFSGGGRLIDRSEKDAVLRALDPDPDDAVLEVACGTGRFAVALAERGVRVTGVDVSAPMLERARDKARRRSTTDRVAFLRGDAARLPFPDGAFDAVLAMRFFHLADRPVRFLRELRRVSRGPVVFDTFRRYSSRSVYNWLLPMDSRLYSRAEVEGLLDDAGLHLDEEAHDFVLPYGVYRALPETVARPLRAVDDRLGNAGGEPLASVSYWRATG